MKKLLLPLILPLLLAIGCATSNTPQATQLQIREFQTRSFPTNDVKLVMKAMFNVLQDDGFVVKNANMELGLLSATKDVDVEKGGEKAGAIVGTTLFNLAPLPFKIPPSWKKNSTIEATANVSDFGSACRVRMTFQVKSMDNKGEVREVKQIDDANFYQTFFAKVDKGLFIQREKL